ncbi:alanine racemase [Polymorphobacter fuscus]|uniref:Alanine racemase n=1 Tax=Sandarakinorhabdus fusca TaxID=1439888 RepID=A0A7C9GUZ3_9SPHN|nr:alanine racemase [Polymorphobacter fuscus]KAB7647887.1 alanine racemase [Polymorphobacter fuscus]MQT17198.1 alanine racemase [Polymorphobacter fuscus]
MPASPLSARLHVDTAAIVANWRRFAVASGPADCGAAIKADGYGLGARPVLAALAAAGCRDAFVAHWDEVAALGPLPEGVRVAVLHGAAPAEIGMAMTLPARPVLVTAAQVAAWRATGRPCDIMVDTGMNRLGLSPAEAVSGLLDGLAVDTLHSHLACTEEPLHPLNAAQRAVFADVAARVPARRYALANSGGVCLGPDYVFGLTRPGIGLYGGGAAPGGARLDPVVQLSAPVLQVRDVPPGGGVGYGASFVAARPTRVAVVGLGYADGYPRSAAGFGVVDGVVCPLIGRVSMDLTTFDVTDAPAAREGSWIDVGFDLAAMAAASGRSQYELLTGLGRRYARTYR